MKQMSIERQEQVMKLFKLYNYNPIMAMKRHGHVLVANVTAIGAVELKPLLEAGFLVSVYSSIGDEMDENSLTVHVFEAD